MLKSKFAWKYKTQDKILTNPIDEISKSLGIFDFEKHHNLGFKDLYSPYLFKNMEDIVALIKKNIAEKGKIMIYGDYDVDGITATSLLYRVLEEMDALVVYDVPDRFTEGYGLNYNAVNKIINDNIKLLITVDNGITAIDEISELRKNGIDVIVTDHHEPKEVLPDANYILHAFLDDNYPYTHLAGVGVAFKLAQALNEKLAYSLIDLAMLGTIADMMILDDENQAIVNCGLKKINDTSILGLKKILDLYQLSPKTSSDISFNLAPKINSLGRMGKAKVAIDLLITDDPYIIYETIDELKDIDQERKNITKENTETALSLINSEDFVNIVCDSSLHEGVLGIVAQKLVHETYKVSGVFYNDGGICKGSFRSIPGVNILNLLDNCKDLILRYGGHEMAAGIQIEEANISKLKERLNDYLKDQKVEKELNVIGELDRKLVTVSFYEELVKYSLENHTYVLKGQEIIKKSLLLDKHTKLTIKSDNNILEAIAFNEPSLYYNVSEGDFINIAGTFNLNVWNNKKNVQIILKDYEVLDFQIIDLRNVDDFNKAKSYFMDYGLLCNESLESIEKMKEIIKEKSPGLIYLGYNGNNRLTLISSVSFLREAIKCIIIKKQLFITDFYKQIRVNDYEGDLIISIFQELGLILLEDDKIIYNGKNQVKLEESSLYNKIKKKIELINFFTYKRKDDLKKYILEILED